MTLHIYAQEQWHDSAYIVGTRTELLKLQAAVTKAIQEGKAAPSFFACDGEGYDVVIRCVDDHTAGRLTVPYTSEMAMEKEGSGRLRPWDPRFDNPEKLL